MHKVICLSMTALFLTACGRGDHLGKAPSFSEPMESKEHSAMVSPGLPCLLYTSDAADE